MWAGIVDESELELYLDQIDMLDTRIQVDAKSCYDIAEQLRDNLGERVHGCYYMRPAPTYT